MKLFTQSAWLFLFGGLVAFIITRFALQPTYEQNIDTSSWISSAISAARSDAPFWTLLNYSDSRPLTIFPLFVLEFFGIAVDWAVAGRVGVVIWSITIVFFYLTLCCWFTNWRALFYTLPLLVFQATNLEDDLMAYNSEHICVLMLAVGCWALARFEKSRKPLWQYIAIGFWLGMLPFVKMQTVPMGLVLGLGFAFFSFQHRYYWGIFWLVIGSILPTLLVNLYYFQKDDIATFWNDYFWNYYYYSFTQTYSKVAVYSRFGPRYIFQFFYISPYTRVFWLFIAGVLIAGLIAWFKKRNNDKSHTSNVASAQMHWLMLLFCFSSFYAVLQAGNPFTHYLLLLVVPALLLAALLMQHFSKIQARRLWLFFIVAIGLEGINNLRTYSPKTPPAIPVEEIEVSRKIQQLIKANQKMTTWGYADRFFVWSRVAAGNRISHTFWAYWPNPMIAYRQQQLLEDLEQNRTEWFLDFSTSSIKIDFSNSSIEMNQEKFRHDNFSKIAYYIRKNYQLVDTIRGVRFYRRNQ